jgi:hypothetical protein
LPRKEPFSGFWQVFCWIEDCSYAAGKELSSATEKFRRPAWLEKRADHLENPAAKI